MNLRTGPEGGGIYTDLGAKGGYPHKCKIVRMVGMTEFSDGEELILYEGECVMFGSGQMRKFQLGNVVKADYCVEIPYVLNNEHLVMSGDLISVEGRCENWDVVVSTPDEVFWMGTTVYFNETKN